MQTVMTRKALEIPPFIVMEVMERAHELEKQGQHIIHLEIGEPDFKTPSCICDAAREAMTQRESRQSGPARPTTPTAWASSRCGKPSVPNTATNTASGSLLTRSLSHQAPLQRFFCFSAPSWIPVMKLFFQTPTIPVIPIMPRSSVPGLCS